MTLATTCPTCDRAVEAHDKAQSAACVAQMLGVPVPTDQAGEAAQARQAAAWAHLQDFVAWVNDGSEVLGRLWDALPDADSVGLCDLLRLLTNREAGLQPALGMLVREVERTLGDRHGRGPIMDGDVPVGDVARAAGSTKWDVEKAWPDVAAAIRQAERLVLDQAAGELEDDTARALRILKQLAGVSYLRVEACAALGLDPDDYREKGNYRWSVKLP